jgi:hypothetical protein
VGVTKGEFEVEMGVARIMLDAILKQASSTALLRPNTIAAWSCADVLAHLAGYTRSIADDLAAAGGRPRHGPDYQTPADATIDEYNATVVAYWRRRQLDELLDEERTAFIALTDEVMALSEDAIADVGHFEFVAGRSLADILPNNSYEHYHMHLADLKMVALGTSEWSPVSNE